MKPRNGGYTAAMIDGEGCISIASYIQRIKKAGGGEYQYCNTQLAVSIFQTDERLMKWLKHHYGGTYTPRKPKVGKRQGWSWVPAHGKNLERFLLKILPYLLLKREQALLALEYIRLGNGKSGPNNGNADLQKKRQDLAVRCSNLNQRKSPEANTSNISSEMMIESRLMSDHESESVVIQNS
jgi:hypothetical protein